MTVCIMELWIFVKYRDNFIDDYNLEEEDEEFEEDEELLEDDTAADVARRFLAKFLMRGMKRMLRPKKKARGDLTFDVAEYYSYPKYE